jgi:hypothetical protein
MLVQVGYGTETSVIGQVQVVFFESVKPMAPALAAAGTTIVEKPRDRSIFAWPMADYALVVAPVWIGAVYLAAVSFFPDCRTFIFFLFLVVLGESHFGATWLFFLGRENRRWLWERRFRLVYLPLVITAVYVLIGAANLEAAIMIGAFASGVHVTRQSIGIYRLYGGERGDANERAIYAASFGFLGIGFARFYAPKLALSPSMMDLVLLLTQRVSLVFLCWVLACLVLAAIQLGGSKRWFAVVTGAAIYFPYCLVQFPQDAIAIGVGMHWCQYLAINYAIYGRRAFWHRADQGSVRQAAAVVGLIGCYAVVMAAIGTSAGTRIEPRSVWLLLPLCGQILHYYIDAFIWRFSDPHIRKNVGSYLWAR